MAPTRLVGFVGVLQLTMAVSVRLPAETVVSGTLPSVTWSLDGSPYLVSGDLLIDRDASLTIQPGVEVLLAPDVTVLILGSLLAGGSPESPVRFARGDPGAGSWGGLVIRGETASATLEHVELTGGSRATVNTTSYPAALNVRGGAKVALRSCWLHDLSAVVVDSTGGSELIVRDSLFERSLEAIHSDTSYALVEGVTIREIIGHNDCIDYDGESTPRSVIRDCLLEANHDDDAIDLGGSSALVENVTIRHITGGKAISIDLDCSPLIRRVLVHDCLLGLVVKDSSTPSFEHCTVTRCETAISCYEKFSGRGGGHGWAENMIVWGNESSVELDSLSTFEMSYSIVEGGYPGEGNLDEDPLLVDPANDDFRPSPDSPAASAGRAGTPMGALAVAGPVDRTFLRGDPNRDLRIDVSDAVTVLFQVFRDGAPSCPDASDVDDDGSLQPGDPVYLLRYLFLGGPDPPAPFPGEGPDPTTGDGLGCLPPVEA